MRAQGGLTAVWWEGPYYHPKEFGAGEVTASLIRQLRGAEPDPSNATLPLCNAAAALESGAALWPTQPAVAARCAAFIFFSVDWHPSQTGAWPKHLPEATSCLVAR